MKNKLIVSFFVGVVLCNHMVAMQPYDYNDYIQHGKTQEIIVKKHELSKGHTWKFGEVVGSGFTQDGTSFILAGHGFGAQNLVYDLQGRQVDSLGKFPRYTSNLTLVSQRTTIQDDPFENFASLYGQYTTLAWQQCRAKPDFSFEDESIISEAKFSDIKEKGSAFMYYNPEDGIDATQPVHVHGYIYVIMSQFPDISLQHASDDHVMEYVQNCKRVCAYEVRNRKMVLVREFGVFPWCAGLYVNPTKPMLAILYGDGQEREKSLKFITLHDTRNYRSYVDTTTFSDMDIVCKN